MEIVDERQVEQGKNLENTAENCEKMKNMEEKQDEQ